MTEITLRFQTHKAKIDPDFFENLDTLARKYGLRVKQNGAHPDKLTHEEFLRQSDEISRRIWPVKSDSAEDIRSLRDSR